MTDLRPRRLLLTAAELAVLAAAALPDGAALPPGFDLDGAGAGEARPVEDAEAALTARGLLDGTAAHPALAADLRRLAAPEVLVLVEASCPGLDVTAAVAVEGPLGAALLRTGGGSVQLSAFSAASLADELGRVVPARTAAPAAGTTAEAPQVLPLADLAEPPAGSLAEAVARRWGGSLRATVLGQPATPGGAVPASFVDWVWLTDPTGGRWAALEPAGPDPLSGLPQVAVRAVEPAELGPAVAPAAALLLADRRGASG
ncbi:MAG TPA: ESX secretion-associated protein EspG [Mycobacteriales bacterium]|nr:ESX secretion-associated protein EspG [Mycobacteriales bacterium]